MVKFEMYSRTTKFTLDIPADKDSKATVLWEDFLIFKFVSNQLGSAVNLLTLFFLLPYIMQDRLEKQKLYFYPNQEIRDLSVFMVSRGPEI